ncbi:hypothetical protein CMK11_18775 [Candidatus Poribacteria bacterium]|nr:hypothetical protein [Candidatus Poribacteria bacterium]
MMPPRGVVFACVALTCCCHALAGPSFQAADMIALVRMRADDLPLPDVSKTTTSDLGPVWALPLRASFTPDAIRTPGDPRPYRHGVHQGTDFYGVGIGEPVYPAATGFVIRADVEYTRTTPVTRRAMLTRCRAVGATPGEYGVAADPRYGDILDKLRGRQVWLYHGDTEDGVPVLSVYAHLSGVEPLHLGEYVGPDRQIGAVGNTGTSEEGTDGGAHLHMEVYVGERYWSPREPEELGHVPPSARRRELREATLRALGWSPADG